MSRPAQPRGDALGPFRYADYRRFVTMVFFLALAQQAQGVAVGWDVYERTGSALALGLVGLAQFLPVLAFFLPAGQLADRYDRRRMILASLALWGASAALLAWSSWTHAPVAATYVAIAMTGAGTVLNRAARDAMVPALVPLPLLARGVAFNQGLFQTASFAGPAIAGLLIATSGAALAVHLFDLVCIAIGVGAVVLMAPHAMHGTRAPASWSGVFAGLLHVWRTKLVLGTMLVDLVAVLFGSVTALLPIYAKDILDAGAGGLGILSAAPAVGAALMAVTQGLRRTYRHAGNAFLGAVAVFGLATLVFAFSTSFWLSAAALVVVGAADNLNAVIRQTVVQIYTPDDLRGRVSAVNRVFISSSNELGTLESGLVAAMIGPVFTAALGGVATLAVALMGRRLFPEIARLRTLG
jgi:MFS family permease